MRSWGGFNDAHIKEDPHFEILRQAGVHFYDVTAKVTSAFHVKTSALQSYNVASEAEFFDLDDIENFDDLVEYEEGDGGYEGVVVPDGDADSADKSIGGIDEFMSLL